MQRLPEERETVSSASSPEQHWELLYQEKDIEPVADDDSVGLAALAHLGDLRGRRLLDLGCGNGEYSLFFAAHGAEVVAVDRSVTAIERLRAQCEAAGLAVEPRVADAFGIERLGPFDAAFGSMILHHLEPFDEFAAVLRRAVRPGGRAFFYENNAASGLLLWCRKHLTGRFGIPKNSDDLEFPLEPREIDVLRAFFDVQVVFPELLLARMFSAYVLRGHGDRAMEWIDSQLYRFEGLRAWSYHQYVMLG
jgi:2-polyprenyl-3-methyl-5-hydroxy-6-metoxy-1,4-benzoquinol methylase